MNDLANPEALRPKLRGLLKRTAGADAQAEAMVVAAVRLCEDLVHQLVPLVGEAGVAALTARTLHLTAVELPWLVLSTDEPPGADSFCQLRAGLAREPPERAADAATVFIATFCALLTSLVGDAVTKRLLRQAWPADFHQEHGPETTT